MLYHAPLNMEGIWWVASGLLHVYLTDLLESRPDVLLAIGLPQ